MATVTPNVIKPLRGNRVSKRNCEELVAVAAALRTTVAEVVGGLETARLTPPVLVVDNPETELPVVWS
jgi:hypothetical protein